jgi:hypothetical protein
MAVLGIALVVLVFVTLLSLAAGFSKAVECSGSSRNIIILRKGADAELQSQVTLEAARVIEGLPCVAAGADGQRLCINESVIIRARPKRGGGETNITVRGTLPLSRVVHTDVRLREGRWLAPGSSEAVIGTGLSRRIENFPLMQSAFRRRNIYQSVLFRADGNPQAALRQVRELIGETAADGPPLDPRLADPRLQTVMAEAEDEYYRKQAKLMSDFITILGGILTSIMAVGAIVGAMNTMYAAVSQRKREIGCLLAMGFTPDAVWLAFMAESLLLSALGAVAGCAISLSMDGMKTGMANWATFSETAFEFAVTPEILVKASVLALLMGFIGGVAPAFRAARMKVVDALRRA